MVVKPKAGNCLYTIKCTHLSSCMLFIASSVGVFCSVVNTIEMCKTEAVLVVDVFQVVKALHIQKPGAVLTVV